MGGWVGVLLAAESQCFCKRFMKAALFGKGVGETGETVTSSEREELERNEDRQVQLDICEGQASGVCGFGKLYDGSVGAL